MSMTKKPTSFRLSEPTLKRLDRLARRMGVSKTAVVELLVRKAYQQFNKA